MNDQYNCLLDYIISEFQSSAMTWLSDFEPTCESSHVLIRNISDDFFNLATDTEQQRYAHYEISCFETSLHQLYFKSSLMIKKNIEHYNFVFANSDSFEHKSIIKTSVNRLKDLLISIESKKNLYWRKANERTSL